MEKKYKVMISDEYNNSNREELSRDMEENKAREMVTYYRSDGMPVYYTEQ